MSRTWTAAALSSERRRFSGACWRVVEAQHRVATMKLVDTLAEHDRLERLLDEGKPDVPPACRHLHYLLYTPFRYAAPYPRGSRFRRAGFTAGVFYGSRTPITAIAELVFHRLLLFADSPATPWPVNPGEFTAFAVKLSTRAALDLTTAPLDAEREQWMHPTNYGACQDLSDRAREANVDVLRYESVRDPEHGTNIAVLACRVFKSSEPIAWQTWRVDLSASGARAVCAYPEQRVEFSRETFAADPRIVALTWDRPRFQ